MGHVLQCNTQLTVLLLQKWLKFVFQLSNSSFLLQIFSKCFTHSAKFDFDDFHSCSTFMALYYLKTVKICVSAQ